MSWGFQDLQGTEEFWRPVRKHSRGPGPSFMSILSPLGHWPLVSTDSVLNTLHPLTSHACLQERPEGFQWLGDKQHCGVINPPSPSFQEPVLQSICSPHTFLGSPYLSLCYCFLDAPPSPSLPTPSKLSLQPERFLLGQTHHLSFPQVPLPRAGLPMLVFHSGAQWGCCSYERNIPGYQDLCARPGAWP